MWRGQVTFLLVLLGSSSLVIGAGLALDLISLRLLVVYMDVDRAIKPVFTFRLILGHSGAQAIEAACAALGLGMLGWSLRVGVQHIRPPDD